MDARPTMEDFARSVSGELVSWGERPLRELDHRFVVKGWVGRLSPHETAAMVRESREYEREEVQAIAQELEDAGFTGLEDDVQGD